MRLGCERGRLSPRHLVTDSPAALPACWRRKRCLSARGPGTHARSVGVTGPWRPLSGHGVPSAVCRPSAVTKPSNTASSAGLWQVSVMEVGVRWEDAHGSSTVLPPGGTGPLPCAETVQPAVLRKDRRVSTVSTLPATAPADPLPSRAVGLRNKQPVRNTVASFTSVWTSNSQTTWFALQVYNPVVFSVFVQVCSYRSSEM